MERRRVLAASVTVAAAVLAGCGNPGDDTEDGGNEGEDDGDGGGGAGYDLHDL